MLIKRFPTICITIKATIGEKSKPPIGGISFLKGAKKNSLNALIDLKGSLFQLIFGNQDKSMVIKRTYIIN